MVSVSGRLDTLIVKAVLVLSPKESCAVTVIVLSPRCAVIVGVPLNDTVVSSVEYFSHLDVSSGIVTVYSRVLLLRLLKAMSYENGCVPIIPWFVVSVVSLSGRLDTLIVKVAVMLSSKESSAVTVIVLSPRCSAVVGVPLNDTVVSSVKGVSHPDAGVCHFDHVAERSVIRVPESVWRYYIEEFFPGKSFLVCDRCSLYW